MYPDFACSMNCRNIVRDTIRKVYLTEARTLTPWVAVFTALILLPKIWIVSKQDQRRKPWRMLAYHFCPGTVQFGPSACGKIEKASLN